MDALASYRPGVRLGGVDPELVESRAEIARLSEALKEMGVRSMLAEGEGAGAFAHTPPICDDPRRVAVDVGSNRGLAVEDR